MCCARGWHANHKSILMQNCLRMLALATALTLGATAGCDRRSQGKPDAQGHADDGGAGHEHDQRGEEGLEPISVTLFTSKVLLFMEYPHLVQGEQAEFLAHFSVLSTGEPVRSGSLTFEVTPPNGSPVNLTLDAPRRDGLFVPEWVFKTPGEHRLRLLLSGPQVKDAVDVGSVIVHADADAAFHAAEAAAEDDPPDLVPFLLEQQWKIGLLQTPVTRRTLVHRLPIPAQIVAPQGASAVVSPPVAGRLLPPPDGKLPRVGDQVQAGQTLALVEPPLQVTDVAQLSANRAWLQTLGMELAQRELELDTKGLEVERSIIQSEARLDFARRAMDRAAQLREEGVGTEQQYDEAQQNLRLAQAEYEGARAMKRFYGDARERLAKLRSQALVAETDTTPTDSSLQMPLRAPIAGEIVSVQHIQGEHLGAQQELFRIVNTEHVWIEASISEFDLAKLLENPGATMTLPSYPGRRFDILGSAGGRLVNIGKVIDPETRTVSVVYELPNPDGLFRVGMFADVHLETQVATEAVAIPEEAILMDSGRPIAFVLLGGESFQRRELELGVRDNGFVEVKAGIEAGERVVTKGAYLIKLASLSPESFSGGHAH